MVAKKLWVLFCNTLPGLWVAKCRDAGSHHACHSLARQKTGAFHARWIPADFQNQELRDRYRAVEEQRLRETCLSRNSYRFLEAGELAQWLPQSLTSLFLCGNTQRHHWVFDRGVSRAFLACMGDTQCCHALAVSTSLLANDPSPIRIRRKSTGHKLSTLWLLYPPVHQGPPRETNCGGWSTALLQFSSMQFCCTVSWETMTNAFLDKVITACI